VAFSARHSSSAGVPRYFHRIGGAFAVRAIGPWARQLPVLVTMLGAGLHSTSHATAIRIAGNDFDSQSPPGASSGLAIGTAGESAFQLHPSARFVRGIEDDAVGKHYSAGGERIGDPVSAGTERPAALHLSTFRRSRQ
jgi:hypothetical protein